MWVLMTSICWSWSCNSIKQASVGASTKGVFATGGGGGSFSMHMQGNDVRSAWDRLPVSGITDCDPAAEQLLYVAQARALLQNDQLDLALQTAKQAFEQQRTQELQQV